MKFLLRLVLILSLCIGAIVLGIYAYLRANAPKYRGEQTLKGLKAPVETYFDDYGIPHIYAQNEEDAYYALGWLHAQERLFQMEMIRRVAGGRLSEILGKNFVQTDKMMRTLGLGVYADACAQKHLSSNEQPYQKAVSAYLKGVNTYLHHGSTPIEFSLLGIDKQDFAPRDIYLTLGYMAFTFAGAFRVDPLMTKIQDKLGREYLQDLALGYQAGTQRIPVFKPHTSQSQARDSLQAKPTEAQYLPNLEEIAHLADRIIHDFPVPVWEGSNSWVLSPSKSASGKVLFCNDPHIAYSQPAVWFEAHLEYPGVSLYGHYLAGMPFANIGHNRRAAWGATMLQNDDVNFYKETLNPQNPQQYRANDKWTDFDTRKETILVKGEAPIQFTVRSTRHGAVVNEVVDNLKDKAPISVYWTFTQLDNLQLQMGYQITKIRTLDQARKVCAMLHAPGLNLMYGDIDGNVAWFASSRYIKLPASANSHVVMDGASGKASPLGFYDFAANPSSENPPSGYVYSANNQPDSTAAMPLYPGYYSVGDRAWRVVQYLDQNKKFKVADMQEMLIDTHSPSAPVLVKLMRGFITPKSETQRKALEILEAWKGEHTLTAVAPVIYNRLHYHVLKNAFEDELGKDDFEIFLKTSVMKHTFPKLLHQEDSRWWDNIQTQAHRETRQELIQKSFEAAIAQLEQTQGGDVEQWQWQKVHILTHPHALGRQGGWLGWIFNVAAGGIMGSNEVLNVSSFTLSADGNYPVAHGASMRIVIDFADVENAQNIIPTGQSGNLMSQHYRDQMPLYNAGKFRKMMMNTAEIQQAKHRKLVFKPE